MDSGGKKVIGDCPYLGIESTEQVNLTDRVDSALGERGSSQYSISASVNRISKQQNLLKENINPGESIFRGSSNYVPVYEPRSCFNNNNIDKKIQENVESFAAFSTCSRSRYNNSGSNFVAHERRRNITNPLSRNGVNDVCVNDFVFIEMEDVNNFVTINMEDVNDVN